MFFLYMVFIPYLLSVTHTLTTKLDLPTLIREIVPVRVDGKIAIPEHVQHIKLDIGLSYSAPISQYWLTHEENLWVFGFEPNPASIRSILQGLPKRPGCNDPLQNKFIGRSFFLIPCALGLSQEAMIPFYVTKNDPGCSSMYVPQKFAVEQVIEVPIFSLADFFDLFPFDTHPVIDYIKIDAQGADLDIAKSAGHYLTERVIYITLEAENGQYAHTVNSLDDIDTYMHSIGFVRYISSYTEDPTYFNPRFTDYVRSHKVCIYQK